MIARNPIRMSKAVRKKIKEVVFLFDLNKWNDITSKQKNFASGFIGFA